MFLARFEVGLWLKPAVPQPPNPLIGVLNEALCAGKGEDPRRETSEKKNT